METLSSAFINRGDPEEGEARENRKSGRKNLRIRTWTRCGHGKRERGPPERGCCQTSLEMKGRKKGSAGVFNAILIRLGKRAQGMNREEASKAGGGWNGEGKE